MSGTASSESEFRKDIVLVCRWMYGRQLVVAKDGNVSCRLPDGNFLMTPSGCCKGTVTEDELVKVDASGTLVGTTRRATSEVVMHLTVYRERPDARAVVHAHPITAVAFTVAGHLLAQCVIPEVVIGFGQIPIAPYATPTTPEMGTAIREICRTADAIILDRHGSLTIGRDVYDAFWKLETLEHAAKITWTARTLSSDIRTLPPDEVGKLLEIREKLGIKGPVHVSPEHCNLCGLCPGPPGKREAVEAARGAGSY